MSMVKGLGSSGCRGRRGLALFPVVIVVTGLVALSSAFLTHSHGMKKQIRSGVEIHRARLIAEAGLAEAVTAIRAGATGQVGERTLPAFVGEGVFWVDVEDLGNNQVRVVSTSMAGSGRHATAMVLQKGNGGLGELFRATLNSKGPLTVNEGVVVDSYDSSLGSYASQVNGNTNGHDHANKNGDVRSNADITINANATILGDATPGTSGTVTFGNNAYVDGSTAPASNDFVFPPIETPSYGSLGPLNVDGPLTLPPGDYEYDSLSISNGKTLTVQGPANIVAPSFTGGKLGRLAIDATNGPVTIYCESYSHIKDFEVVPVGDSPTAVAFMITGTQDIVFPSATKIRGAYYAENSNIVFANNAEGFGSFVANEISMSSGMKFHYDEALAEHWEGGDGKDGVEMVTLARYEAVVPSDLTNDRRDPFAILGLDPDDLPTPAEAWDWDEGNQY